MPLAITRTFSPWTHTSDDSYIYQLSLVLATATVSLFSHLLIATMQSVVTGQAPKTYKIKRYTQAPKQIVYLRQKLKGEISVRTYLIRTCHTRMLNESQQKLKPSRQHSTHKKKTALNKRCPNLNRIPYGLRTLNTANRPSRCRASGGISILYKCLHYTAILCCTGQSSK